jgi:integrase
MFDLEAGVWVKPSAHTKQRKKHRVPLSAAAVALLKEIKSAANSAYVFPGANGNPLTDIKRTWLSVCRTAGLTEEAPKRTRGGKVILGKDGKPQMIGKRRHASTICAIRMRASWLLKDYRCRS